MFEDGLLYQDSRMASCEELEEDLQECSIGARTFSGGGPVLCREGRKIYVDSGDSHTLVIGDTGSMKTLRFVLPLIYSCARAGESMAVVDPKGELVRKMGPFLDRCGYKTVVINLRSPNKSPDHWNPMEKARRSFNGSSEEREKAAVQLNDLLHLLFFSRSNHDKDRYWQESAGQFALGLCLLMESLGEELTIKNLLNWRFEKLRSGELEDYYNALPPESLSRQNLAVYMDLTAENTKSCILSTFDQLVRVFIAAPSLTDMLADSTFNMEDMGRRKTALFLVVPDEKTTFHFLATLFISQCYETLLEQAELTDGVLPVRVNFILEEFCNMPVLEDLIPMLTAARSRNIRFHLVIQSYEQMVSKYGESVSKTVMDNCGNLIYLHSRELSFLQYISSLAGNNEYGRPLLSPSRLQRIRRNETLIFHERCYPVMVQDVPLIFEYPGVLPAAFPKKQCS